MSVDLQTIKNIDFFNDIIDLDLESLLPLLEKKKVIEDEILTRSGEFADRFYILLFGHIMISFDQERAFTLDKKGDIIGYSSLISPFTYTGTARALTKGELIVIKGPQFYEHLNNTPALKDKIMKKINIIITERMFYVTGKEAIV